MSHDGSGSLWRRVNAHGHLRERHLWGADASVSLHDLTRGSILGGRIEELRGRSVLVMTKGQLTAALALIELDGIAQRLVLCPPDLPTKHIPSVVTTAAADAIVSDGSTAESGDFGIEYFICSPGIASAAPERGGDCETEWILLTSGTTGAPKLVLHTLSSLVGAIKQPSTHAEPVVWSTFYDIRRYGGLQVLLRALLGGVSLVLSSAGEATSDFWFRAAACGVTHISGTPSHWRRGLMSPSADRLAPRYVRLSGEIADQAILDNIRDFYQGAKVAHAFASTEAGVAFEVSDGLAGFPASLVNQSGADVEMKIEDGSLRIRSSRTASRYLGDRNDGLRDEDGFVDTGDMIERRGDRYFFIGRKGGIINVGGLKVHPEEVEAVINRHPSVQMSLVKGRKNPITGEVVVADVVVKSDADVRDAAAATRLLRDQILEACHHALAPHKVPAAIRIVPSLNVAASGKLTRSCVISL